MKQVCDTLEVARSNIYDRNRQRKTRGPYYKSDDATFLPMLKKLVDERPTYGYRRVHALLNKVLRADGRPTVNHKRVYRIMKQHGMLLTKYTGKKVSRTHDGKIITLKSNLRWCSDVFEIPCWNKQWIW